MKDDGALLRRYATGGDEAAFRELVERHVPLVYSAALRQLNGDGHLAEDVAQTVFTDLARSAGKLPEEVVLAGWLYRAAQFAAAKAVRTEHRRRVREAAAALEEDNEAMSARLQDNATEWDAVCSHLDAEMNELGEKDRNAILLRFFHSFDFKAMGAALQVSDDTAQKRVTRALEKLRSGLTKRGVTLSISALGTFIANNAVAAPPAGLAMAITSGVKGGLAAGAAVTSGGFFAKLLGALLRHKAACGGGAVVAGALFVASLLNSSPRPPATYDLSRDFSTVGSASTPWSFGWTPTLAGTFRPLGHVKHFLSDNGEPVTAWQIDDSERPGVGRNMGNRTAISAGGLFVGPPGAVWFGAENNDSLHNFAVIRFTVPRGQAGAYRIATAVHSAVEGVISGDTDFHVLKNGAELFGRFLNSNSGTAYSEVVSLAPGDTIEFVAGRGRNPKDESAALRIRATLTTDLLAPADDLKYDFAVAPVIVSPPGSQGEPEGGAGAFEVMAGGSPPLSYQWLLSGSAIQGATERVHRLTDIKQHHVGEYFVIISNVVGAVTSSVARLSIASCVPIPPGVVSWWSAEQSAADRLGGQDGRRLDGTTFAPGRVGRAFLFAGAQAGMQVPASPTLDIGSCGSFTIEMWIQPETVSGKMPLVGWNSTRAYGANLSVVSGRLYANLRDREQTPHTALSAADTVVPGQWQHVALTFDSQEQRIRLFCKGRIVADKYTDPFQPNTKFDLQFGRRLERDGILTYTGLMDEISLYNRALTPEEIIAIAHAGGAGKCVTPETAQVTPTPRQP